ncbi:MAG: hypothetical protein M3O70_19635 [Actinomycetota bacterium]|nr:hypothetical protein [Actinomycetota bacterium]
MAVKEAEPVVEERHKAGHVGAHMVCPTCGLRQRVRVETSPARGSA